MVGPGMVEAALAGEDWGGGEEAVRVCMAATSPLAGGVRAGEVWSEVSLRPRCISLQLTSLHLPLSPAPAVTSGRFRHLAPLAQRSLPLRPVHL